MVGHHVGYAGADECEFDDEGVGVVPRIDQLMRQDLVPELFADSFCGLGNVDSVQEGIAVGARCHIVLRLVKMM